MHYLRFLRPPTVNFTPRKSTLSLVLTIGTDLSDRLLSGLPVDLSVLLEFYAPPSGNGITEDEDTPSPKLTLIDLSKAYAGAPMIWRPGMRVLKLDVPLPTEVATAIARGERRYTVYIKPRDSGLTGTRPQRILSSDRGLIVPVWYDLPLPGEQVGHTALRRLFLSSGVELEPRVEIEEDLGESMARHIWDSAIPTISMLANACLGPENKGPGTPMKALTRILTGGHDLNILEIGTGVGILGLGVATILHARAGSHTSKHRILLTDLPDAEARATANIERFRGMGSKPSHHTDVDVDYENLDWEDGKLGHFGPKLQALSLNLVVVSDCTYNTDTLPALVQTFAALRSHAKAGLQIFLTTKPRHSSERTFFDLMAGDGWSIIEQAVLPLPVLGEEPESVEVYLFGVA